MIIAAFQIRVHWPASHGAVQELGVAHIGKIALHLAGVYVQTTSWDLAANTRADRMARQRLESANARQG